MKTRLLKSIVIEILVIGFIFILSIDKSVAQQKVELCDDFVIKNYTVKAENGIVDYINIRPNTFFQLDSNTIIVKYNKIGTFIITANVSNGVCDAYKNLIVEVIECSETRLYIPNSFTPQGQNPIFKAYGIHVYNYKMQIWNRWGELLFVSNDINIGWDGYYKGTLSQSGIYPGKISYTDKKGSYKEQYFKVNLI